MLDVINLIVEDVAKKLTPDDLKALGELATDFVVQERAAGTVDFDPEVYLMSTNKNTKKQKEAISKILEHINGTMQK